LRICHHGPHLPAYVNCQVRTAVTTERRPSKRADVGGVGGEAGPASTPNSKATAVWHSLCPPSHRVVEFDHLGSSALQDRSLVRANTSTGTLAAVNGLYCRQELEMTQWGSFVCAIFPVVLKGGVDRPVSVRATSTGRTWNRRLHTHRAKGVRFVSLKPGSLKRRSVSVRGLTGDHGKTDGYDVPDAYDATMPIFRRSTAAVSNVKCMTGSTAPGGCRCRLSVEC
jgi:hypothetical protein